MKFFDLIKNRKQKSPEVLALEEQFAAIENIADPGERLMCYREISGPCHDLDNKIGGGLGKIAVASSTGAGVLISGGVFLAVPSLGLGILAIGLSGGLLVGFSSGVALMGGNASYVGVSQVRKQAQEKIAQLETQQDPLSFAASPHFDVIMKNYPTLKERFMMASAKEAALQKQVLQLPAPKPPEQGFRL